MEVAVRRLTTFRHASKDFVTVQKWIIIVHARSSPVQGSVTQAMESGTYHDRSSVQAG